MPVKNEEFLTLCYDNYPDQREFVFAIKGRPFSMLSSQKLSVPSTSLIDYKLVRDLSLKMDDLQCSKFSYGGQKLRILGKISQTVQTISNGITSGTIHLRASVVENLSEIFDSHSIAGKKMTEMLHKSKKIPASSPSKGKSPVRTVSSPSSPSSSPAAIISPASSRPPTPSSPPGFPRVPKYCNPEFRARAVARAEGRSLSPLSSPQPINQHYRTTYCQPQLKQEPMPGIPRRTLALKPDDSHVYGRVVDLKRGNGPGIAVVDYLDDTGLTSLLSLPGYTTAKELQINDPVLVRKDDPIGDDVNRILMVYDAGEEAQLIARGVVFPECPPNLLPSGYYG